MFILPKFFQQPPEIEVVAAVDLGSNSFHMLVARFQDGQIHVLDRLKEMVRLGGGLDENNYLSAESQQRALECLARFGQRLQALPIDNVRIVGTNVFRLAVNAQDFLQQAEELLNHPIEIVSGREEARLIYLGVAHDLGATDGKRLVVDIGGGSTEFIIGQKYSTLERESLAVGCVSMTRKFFADGNIRAKNLRRAEIATQQELQAIQYRFKRLGWDVAIGTSGTLRSVEAVIKQMGWGNKITLEALQNIKQALIETKNIDNINLKGLSTRRAPVFVGGVAIISAVFEFLSINSMNTVNSALREGVILDLLGRASHEDVRETTICNFMTRYLVDQQQAELVENTALMLLAQVADAWDLQGEEAATMLSWAARLHEVGLSIAHDNYQKHGAYLITYSDLAGFSQQEQSFLASLVRTQRRRFPEQICQHCDADENLKLRRLCILLRLAILLQRSRIAIPELKTIKLIPKEQNLEMQFPHQWLEKHPLTQADLQQEQQYLREIALVLDFV